MPDSLNEPLSIDELNDLSDYLESIPDAMSIEMLDGFFTALACSPEIVLPSVYLPYIWGEKHDFNSDESTSKFMTIICKHWNAVVSQLQSSDQFPMVLLEFEDDTLYGIEWSLGFMAGTEIGGDKWHDLMDNEKDADLMFPFVALAYSKHPEEEMRLMEIDEEKRDICISKIVENLPIIYAYFKKERESSTPIKNSKVIQFNKRKLKKQ